MPPRPCFPLKGNRDYLVLRMLLKGLEIRLIGNCLSINIQKEITVMGIPLTQVGPISSMPGWWQKSIREM